MRRGSDWPTSDDDIATFNGRSSEAPCGTAKDYETRATMKRKPISVIGSAAHRIHGYDREIGQSVSLRNVSAVSRVAEM